MLSNTATVEFIEGVVNQEDIVDEIDDIGFTAQIQNVKQISNGNVDNVTKKKATIEIGGMCFYLCDKML